MKIQDGRIPGIRCITLTWAYGTFCGAGLNRVASAPRANEPIFSWNRASSLCDECKCFPKGWWDQFKAAEKLVIFPKILGIDGLHDHPSIQFLPFVKWKKFIVCSFLLMNLWFRTSFQWHLKDIWYHRSHLNHFFQAYLGWTLTFCRYLLVNSDCPNESKHMSELSC